MGTNCSSPKLENFLGGGQERAVLSLDSIFATRQPSLELLQQPITQDGGIHVQGDHHPNHHHHPYYTALQGHGMYHQAATHQINVNEQNNQTHHHHHHHHLGNSSSCDASQITAMASAGGDDFSCLRNWVAGPYPDHDHNPLHEPQMNSGAAAALSLSMSPGSQSSCVTVPRHISHTTETDTTDCLARETKKRSSSKVGQTKQPVHRKSIDTFGQRTSQYRGVTRSDPSFSPLIFKLILEKSLFVVCLMLLLRIVHYQTSVDRKIRSSSVG